MIGGMDHFAFISGGRVSAAVGAILAFALLLLGLTSTAQARVVYTKTGEFGGKGTTEGLFSAPQRLAVDPKTGDIFVVDTAMHRIQVFAPTATSATYLTEFGESELSEPISVAVDPTTGAVYVEDAGLNEVVKYDQTAGGPPTFAKDASFVSPGHGSGAEQVGSFGEASTFFISTGDVMGGIAVDPQAGGLAADGTTGTHDILIADPGNKQIERFTSKGTFAGSFNGLNFKVGQPLIPAFVEPADVAVNDAGEIVVADIRSSSEAQVRRYSATGTYEATLPPTPNSAPQATGVALAADAASGETFVSSKYPGGTSAGTIYGYSGPGASPPDAELESFGCGTGCEGFNGVFGGIAALPAAAGAGARLYAMATDNLFLSNAPTPKVQVYAGLLYPNVATGEATSVTTTSATVGGTIEAEGVALTECVFEYGAAAGSYEHSEPCAEKPGEIATSGNVPVHAGLTGLEPGVVYHFRLSASNANGAAHGGDATFATGASIVSQTMSDVGATYGTLHAQLDPNGSTTSYHFEYDSSEYAAGGAPHGTDVPVPDEGIGGGQSDVAVAETIEGLRPASTYYWRLAATSAQGTVYGPQQILITYPLAPTALPDGRAYELATPSDQNGGEELEEDGPIVLAPDGESVLYGVFPIVTFGNAPNGLVGAFRATRAASGWQSTSVQVPTSQAHPKGLNESVFPVGASADFSTLFYESVEGIAPEDQNGSYDVYAREPDGAFAWISQSNSGGVETAKIASKYAGSSADASHVLFETEQTFTANDSAQIAGERLYERFAGNATLVGVNSDGTLTSACGAVAGSGEGVANAISADGARIFFESPDPKASATCSEPVELYLREDGTTTTEISLSQKSGEVGAPAPDGATYVGAAEDGSKVFFTSPDELTNDAEAVSGGLYVYDVETGVLGFIGKGRPLIGSGGPPAISADGSHVYFVGEAAGGPAGEAGLYLWDEGLVSYIAPAPVGKATRVGAVRSEEVEAQVSADGSTLVFTSTQGVLYRQAYLYRQGAGAVTCISCDPNGVPPTGPVDLSADYEPLAQATNRAVTADGGMAFFSTPSALLPQAANGLRNVYEWEDGTLRLLSDGNGPYETQLVGTSASGRDVIIATRDVLVPQDESKGAGQLYDVRIGGGLPAAAKPGCSGEGCQAAPRAPTLLQPPSSERFNGPGNATKVARKHGGGKLKRELRRALKACTRRYRHNRHGQTLCKRRARHRYGAKAAPARRRHQNRRGK